MIKIYIYYLIANVGVFFSFSAIKMITNWNFVKLKSKNSVLDRMCVERPLKMISTDIDLSSDCD